jgi:hypothetical protein
LERKEGEECKDQGNEVRSSMEMDTAEDEIIPKCGGEEKKKKRKKPCVAKRVATRARTREHTQGETSSVVMGMCVLACATHAKLRIGGV